MLEVRNRSPFSASLTPGLDKHGRNYALVVIKASFTISPLAATLHIAEEQIPPQNADIFYGEAGTSSIKYEADIALEKKGVDIILNGHAYAPAGKIVERTNVSLQVGDYKKSLYIFGDRYWQKDNLTWQSTTPKKFDRMPLVYENAYGGADNSHKQDAAKEFCPYNPLGKGFVGSKREPQEGLPLPNLEDPQHLIEFWDDKPKPAGFGFTGRNWQPRLGYAGTYDEQWQQQRMPLLPMDFDDRYFNGAHPDLILPRALTGGELFTATNLSESGLLHFSLPSYQFSINASIKGKTTSYIPMLDTIIIEPDDYRVQATWRHAIPCAKDFLYIDAVTIDWRQL